MRTKCTIVGRFVQKLNGEQFRCNRDYNHWCVSFQAGKRSDQNRHLIVNPLILLLLSCLHSYVSCELQDSILVSPVANRPVYLPAPLGAPKLRLLPADAIHSWSVLRSHVVKHVVCFNPLTCKWCWPERRLLFIELLNDLLALGKETLLSVCSCCITLLLRFYEYCRLRSVFFFVRREAALEEVDSSELWILVINGFKWALNAIMFLSCVILNSGLGAAWGSRGLWCCVCQRLPELRDSPSECTAVLLGNRTHQDMKKGNDISGLRFVSSPWNIANLHQWEALYLKGWYYNPFASFFSAELKFPTRRGFTEPRVQQLKEDFRATFDSSKHG